MKKRWFVVAFIVILLGIFIWANLNADILDYHMKEHTNTALHIHPQLEIELLGEDYFIPPNVGIDSRGMRVIHTHDSSGEIHIESPYEHQFYMKDFFTIWGKEFSDSCIFAYCEDESNVLEVFVNDKKVESNYGDVPLFDKDKIKIVYRKI